jgi:hypothetical protein
MVSTTGLRPDEAGACDSIDAEIAALDARMRHGYTSQEGGGSRP